MSSEDGEHDDQLDATETDALLSRLRLIEDQPLDRRAEALVQVHEQLRSILEGGDSIESRG
ncbi:MAG: hypothetical protein JWO10_1441 [Microbacteriaceae bacterium]|nr:hypothetical protein [Microbacteriaceae bacterium]